eukprot:CAMPEP_0172539594 /NCGR_PEP_ID=MMETSP1067-20121228/10764_1 /TAXON_ID=265564 ORGANISM="Thalassiosira punctigera, Strain Tpunct2005C2" /NCGR_SAMPLE_ID=MMETSP1067 /ASSEMBLY_ACC=CAM_ASM_000444 /LENGTH=317 /DNA_ID=CAMNT_0013325305 /DNA_START=187 /DNA_END=1140 /DNA_ORIENTATION=-
MVVLVQDDELVLSDFALDVFGIRHIMRLLPVSHRIYLIFHEGIVVSVPVRDVIVQGEEFRHAEILLVRALRKLGMEADVHRGEVGLLAQPVVERGDQLALVALDVDLEEHVLVGLSYSPVVVEEVREGVATDLPPDWTLAHVPELLEHVLADPAGGHAGAPARPHGHRSDVLRPRDAAGIDGNSSPPGRIVFFVQLHVVFRDRVRRRIGLHPITRLRELAVKKQSRADPRPEVHHRGALPYVPVEDEERLSFPHFVGGVVPEVDVAGDVVARDEVSTPEALRERDVRPTDVGQLTHAVAVELQASVVPSGFHPPPSA